MTPAWTADWAWALLLIPLTLALHVSAIIGIALLLARAGRRFERRGWGGRHAVVPVAIAAITTVGWLLAMLHGLEATIWAVVYRLVGALPTMGDAILFSVDSLTARGASGIEPRRAWALMGALEAVNGLLLFGISTAFVAAVISEVWNRLIRVARPADR